MRPFSVTWKRLRSSSRFSPITMPSGDAAVLVHDAVGARTAVGADLGIGQDHRNPRWCSGCAPRTFVNSSERRNRRAAHDAAARDDGIHRGCRGIRRRRRPNFRRRVLFLVRPDGPVAVVEVQLRQDVREVHVRFVEGVDGADVAPSYASPLAMFTQLSAKSCA